MTLVRAALTTLSGVATPVGVQRFATVPAPTFVISTAGKWVDPVALDPSHASAFSATQLEANMKDERAGEACQTTHPTTSKASSIVVLT